MKDLFTEFRSEFKCEFSAQLESMVDKSTTDAVARVSESLLQKISVLEQENKSLKLRLDELENYSRSDNLIIHGLPEPAGQSDQTLSSRKSDQLTREVILDLCQNRLELNIQETDISMAHRIRRNGKDAHRPVIVHFTSRRARDDVFRARQALRTEPQPNTSPININEHQTQTNVHLCSHARKLVKEGKIHSTWTTYIFVHLNLQSLRP